MSTSPLILSPMPPNRPIKTPVAMADMRSVVDTLVARIEALERHVAALTCEVAEAKQREWQTHAYGADVILGPDETPEQFIERHSLDQPENLPTAPCPCCQQDVMQWPTWEGRCLNCGFVMREGGAAVRMHSHPEQR